VLLDPCQEQFHRVLIGAARMFVADFAEEELLRGEDGIVARAGDDGGQLIRDCRGKTP
jgi:hypothetical protein